MQDLIGRTLGHYRVVEQIGAGGMGVVYRATDQRLDREVAIKVLPEEVARDEERLARFEREAKLLASLSHQNIAHLYGLETVERTVGEGFTPSRETFLVMELAEGETLADRIERAPVPIDDALDWAKQIAEGLEAAHEKGIIHRDLKPANVMLSPEGQIKILDFGLAKAWYPESSDVDLNESPTLTAGMTRTGTLLGTAAYMSPEQARGKVVDKRTDIWAFGCVLFELLTRQRAFRGDDASQIAAAILRDEPDWAELPPATPNHIRRLLARCLVKKPHDRLHDIADARIAIEEAGEFGGAVREAPATPGWSPGVLVAGVVAAAVLGAIVGGFAMRLLDRPMRHPVMAVHVQTPDPFPPTWGRADVAISPDGRHIVSSVWDGRNTHLVHRRLDEFSSRSLPGSEDCRRPFFSPDSQWIGFFCKENSQLKKASLAGGDPVELCEDCGAVGTWSPDGDEIITSSSIGGPVRRVSAAGGATTVLLESEPEERRYANAEFLPDGRSILLQVRTGPGLEDLAIAAFDLETFELEKLLPRGLRPRYAPSGHLVFERGGDLYAVAFDADRRAVSGEPVPVRDGVLSWTSWDFSSSGTLAWVDAAASDAQCWLAWVDRRGVVTRLFDNSCLSQPRLSPDGSRVALGGGRIVVYDLETGIAQQLTHEGDGWSHFPVWSPQGHRVVFGSRFLDRDARDDIYSIQADFSGAAEVLHESAINAVPYAFSPSGELVFQLVSAGEGDIWVLPADGGEPRLVVGGEPRSQGAGLSPDGRFIAYSSDRSGTEEIYVAPFPEGGSRVQVSPDGGIEPRWSSVGDELFYRDRARMIAVPITLEPDFAITGEHQVLFENDALLTTAWQVQYDVDRDGQRFLVVETVLREEELVGAERRINLITNWFTELERLVPTD